MSFIFVVTIGLPPSCYGCPKTSSAQHLKSRARHRKQTLESSNNQTGMQPSGPSEALRQSELELDQLRFQFQKQARAISEKEFSDMNDGENWVKPTSRTPVAAIVAQGMTRK
jgi:hypothetical protein